MVKIWGKSMKRILNEQNPKLYIDVFPILFKKKISIFTCIAKILEKIY